jgi:hypothetical protein
MRSLTGLANKPGSKGAQGRGLLNTQTSSFREFTVYIGRRHSARIRDDPPEGPYPKS